MRTAFVIPPLPYFSYYTNIMNNLLSQGLKPKYASTDKLKNLNCQLVAFGVDLTKISTRLSITPNETRENINNICSKKIFKKTFFLNKPLRYAYNHL